MYLEPHGYPLIVGCLDDEAIFLHRKSLEITMSIPSIHLKKWLAFGFLPVDSHVVSAFKVIWNFTPKRRIEVCQSHHPHCPYHPCNSMYGIYLPLSICHKDQLKVSKTYKYMDPIWLENNIPVFSKGWNSSVSFEETQCWSHGIASVARCLWHHLALELHLTWHSFQHAHSMFLEKETQKKTHSSFWCLFFLICAKSFRSVAQLWVKCVGCFRYRKHGNCEIKFVAVF